MSAAKNAETLRAAWDALGRGDWDALAAYYSADTKFILPGQNDALEGRENFRAALESIGDALPTGFEIKSLRYFSGEDGSEIVNIVEWTSKAVSNGSQSAILWKFNEAGEITEERWYVDTEQWKAAF